MSETRSLVQTLWDYLCLRHPLEKCDAILVLGSYDIRSAEHGAKLWLDSWAPMLIFSGGLGNFTKDHYDEPEAQRFARRALELGVAPEAILIEEQSTNSGENLQFTQQMLLEKGLVPQRLIVVQKPNMLRRLFATCEQQWPQVDVLCHCMDLTFEDIPHGHMQADQVISEMVGDLQRIIHYPELGFQSLQEVPNTVMQAYEALIAKGYTSHMFPV